MRSSDIVASLNQADKQRGALVSAFISTFGKMQLLTKEGIEFLRKVNQSLVKLRDDMQLKGSEQTVLALNAITNLLTEMCQEKGSAYPNNSYNFYHNSKHSTIFFDTVYPNGAASPVIKDDLCAAMCKELELAINGFSTSYMKGFFRVGFNGYALKAGDPIQEAKANITIALQEYNTVGKDINLIRAADNIENKLNQLLAMLEKTPADSPTHSIVEKYAAVVELLKAENVQFTDSEKTAGLSNVAAGVVLPKLLACEALMRDKFQLPVEQRTLPDPADPGQFKDQLIGYCKKVIQEIKENPGESLKQIYDHKVLKSDVEQRLQQIETGKLPLADASLQLYASVLDVMAKKSGSDTIANAFDGIKTIVGSYNVNITVASVTQSAQAERQEKTVIPTTQNPK